jgi:hypothetical protein
MAEAHAISGRPWPSHRPLCTTGRARGAEPGVRSLTSPFGSMHPVALQELETEGSSAKPLPEAAHGHVGSSKAGGAAVVQGERHAWAICASDG